MSSPSRRSPRSRRSGRADLFTDLHTVNMLDLTQLKADYTRPMPAQAS